MARRRHNPTTDEIQAIIRGNQSIEEKQRLFINIGLSDVETRGLIWAIERRQGEQATEQPQPNETAQYSETVRAAIDALSRYTFGVEIECFAHRTDIMQNCQQNGILCTSEGYNHTDSHEHFKLVSDGSLQGLENPVECVSSVLQYNEQGRAKMKAVCTALEQSSAKVNKTCGLHVHIGAQDMSDAQYCNIFVNYMYLTPIIESWLADSRKYARWCKHISDSESRVLQATSKNAMFVALHGDRYYQVNPDAYTRHGTVEFRQHQGTTEYEKISNWLAFCVKLCEWSKANRLTAETAPRSIDEIEFLNDTEKTYFKGRAAHFAAMQSRRAAA